MSTGCHPKAWFRAACHVVDVQNNTVQPRLNYRTPIEKIDCETPDITGLLQYEFWEHVLYQNYTSNFPSTNRE